MDTVKSIKQENSSLSYLQTFGRKANIIFLLFAGMGAVVMQSPLWMWSIFFIIIYIVYSAVTCYYHRQLDGREFLCCLVLCGALACVGTLFCNILFQLLLLRMVIRVGQLRAVRAAAIVGAIFALTALIGAKVINENFWMDIAYNLLGMGIVTIMAIHMNFIFRSKKDFVELTRQNSLNFQMAFTDALTGLFNYRAYQEKMAVMQDRYILLIIDIDHFKKVNDTYGHEFGNNVLVHLANIIKNSIRYSDMAFRYGGEEFVIVLPGATEEVGMRIAERLRVQVEEQQFYFEANKITVTISIGVAVRQCGFSAQMVFEQADRALYIAKDSGRNRVEAFVS
ncbi:MAG: GGDEF domain-containing protein [Pelosinus sp.]|nr:GGDEF domain-containing protein [Pelosinus sp.]